jgi:VIT1/CCC1 family predicted Fe2+/Mn2+ transporter
MLIGALGCNLAWGIIDGGVYLLTQVNSRARLTLMLRATREAPDLAALQRIIADALPASVASILPAEQLELMRQRLRQLPEQRRSRLTRHDWISASVVCVLSFLATFPIVIPFIFVGEARTALRISNIVATAMLFFCGYAFGQRSGMRPWATGLSMVAIGGGFVGVAISLGG